MKTDYGEWVEINNFRPGIVSRSGIGSIAAPAPLGAAQETNTYRCVALPAGGLGPLPKRKTSFSVTAPEASAPQSGYWIVGAYAYGPQNVTSGAGSEFFDNLFVAVAYQISGTNQQRHRMLRLRLFASPLAVDTIKSINSGYTSTTDFYEPSWMGSSRAKTTAPFTDPGNPVAFLEWSTPGGANEAYVTLFPDPSNPNVTGVLDLTTTRWGHVLGHQGRVVLLQSTSYSFGASGSGSPTNEQISFTDPANSTALGTQQQVFTQEFPNGYGAHGSISAGELFLVKAQGGGVIVSGDIANPTITRLPGVISTGGNLIKSAATPYGLVYGTRGSGPCLWRGSDTSDILAPQLNHESFYPLAAAPGNVSLLQTFEYWGRYTYATNNWVYDHLGNGWWLSEDRSLVNIQHWTKGWDSNYIYGCPPSFSQAAPVAAYAYDLRVLASSYSWQSHPIPQSINRVIDIREIALLAQGTGTVAIHLTRRDGTTRTETFTVASENQPVKLRLPTECIGDSIITRIVSDSGDADPAPTVYSVALLLHDLARSVAA